MTALTFDDTYDVIVVGYGFAGAVAAIEAANRRNGAGSGKGARPRRDIDLLARGNLLYGEPG